MALTRRTQILLDDERYARLEKQAAESGRSVGAIIREAIDARLGQDDEARRRAEAAERLLAEPLPSGREPDWHEVKHLLDDERHRRWYPDEDG